MSFLQGRNEEDDQEKHHSSSTIIASSSTSPYLAPLPEASSSSSSSQNIEKEHMFDKIVTPSDVGKLNRLVIPKQHAERYFPLDTSTHEKGLLLNFEDRTGKPWRFRYSYWNSSQSYVMTKGWSRFVKEKRLDAGDTVSFGRGVIDKERLFIDWRRRPEVYNHPRQIMRSNIPLTFPSSYPMVSFGRSMNPWASPGRLLVPQASFLHNAAGGGVGATSGGQFLVFRTAVGLPPSNAMQLANSSGTQDDVATLGVPMVLDSVPVVQNQAAATTVRLFGVNLDLPKSQGSGEVSSSSSASPKGKDKEELSLDLEM